MSDSDHGNVPQGCNGGVDVIAAPMADKVIFDHSETVDLRRNDPEANSPSSNGISNEHESQDSHPTKAVTYDVEACNEKEQDKLLLRTDNPPEQR